MRLIRNRLLLKSFTVFFALEIILNTLLPTISWALTGGPSAPEFSSFEPVDTTDMVNLATGDFVYNTPIIEIPGPEGGYPLSLSYHSGITVDQEASWVGLGFTLNPGAINRTVNGYADDNVESKRQVRDYWGGGTAITKAYSVGLSAFGFNLSHSWENTTDTYSGFSTNSSNSLNMNLGHVMGVGLYAGFRADSKGNLDAEGYLGVKRGESSLGMSIDSKGIQENVTVAGYSLQQMNNYAGRTTSITRELRDQSRDINIYVGSVGFNYSKRVFYTRYWSDESQNLYTFGSLYPGLANEKIKDDHYTGDSHFDFISYAFDTYDLMGEEPIHDRRLRAEGILANDLNIPARQMGGSLPAYDQFSVLGQGIGGVIRPVIFENGDLFGQSFYERGFTGEPVTSFPTLEYKSMRKFSDKKVDFRFLNDFSNALTITPPSFDVNTTALEQNVVDALAPGFNNGGTNQKLAGSKHIEWFSNEEIADGSAKRSGFIDTYTKTSDRKLQFDVYENYLQPEAGLPYSGRTYGKGEGSFTTDSYTGSDPYAEMTPKEFRSLKPTQADLKKKIGGFMITNESGVTYHYALPVYNYNEYTRTKLRDPHKGTTTFTEFKNDDPYAYTWLLTAITGPDYVDRSSDGHGNGILDDEDWGYWVKFDYGRWADSYQWRTPHTGYLDDVESESVVFSYGIKELYYLDAVETRSHKAIFIKSKRKDAKGVTSRLEGGSNPRRFNMHYKYSDLSTGDLLYSVSPVSTMKLDAVYLFDKKDLNNIPFDKARGDKYMEAPTSAPYAYEYTGTSYSYDIPYTSPKRNVAIRPGEDYVYVKYHNGDLVYDDDDIHDLPQFREIALRTVEFNTDYSLAKGVPNSIGYLSDLSFHTCPSIACSDDLVNRVGKDFEWPLTDASCNFTSDNPFKNGDCCSRAEKFYSKNGLFSLLTSHCSDTYNNYIGNKITYFRTGKLTLNSLQFLGKGGASLIPPTNFVYNKLLKNPDYAKDKYDEWGYYKSDYLVKSPGDKPTRRITSVSAANVDAWTLQSVELPLGSTLEMEFEPNQYNKSVYNNFSTFSIDNIVVGTASDEVKITLKEKNIDLTRWFSIGNSMDVKALFVYKLIAGANDHFLASSNIYQGSTSDIITNIDSETITVRSSLIRAIIDKNAETRYLPRGGSTTYPCVSYFASGFLKADDPDPQADGVNPKYCGGIRVRSVSINGENGKSKSVFNYTDPVTGKPSGVTSFVPYNIEGVHFPSRLDFLDQILFGDRYYERRDLLVLLSNFQNIANAPYLKAMTFTQEAPGPGAIYEYTTQHNYFNDIELDTYTENRFQIFKEEMVSRVSSVNDERKLVTIENDAVDVGHQLHSKIYTAQDILVKSINYGYLYDDINEPYEQESLDSKQGIIEQSFHKYLRLRAFKVDYDYADWWEKNIGGQNSEATVNTLYDQEKLVVTKRADRSNALTSVVETDHRLGTTTTTQNYAFDFYTGQATRVVTTDSYGNRFMAITEPAYGKYPGMGLKIYNSGNKHMLSQEASSMTVKLNPSNNEYVGLLSASVQTWSDQTKILNLTNPQTNIWRKQATYVWNGNEPLLNDGTYPYNNVSLFNWSKPSLSSNWLKTSEVTLYDVNSQGLEEKDLNNLYNSVRLDNDHRYVIASASNARYAEMAYSGVENLSLKAEGEGGVQSGSGHPSRGAAHTGEHSLSVAQGTTGFNYTLHSTEADLTKKYRASVWVYAPGNAETQPDLDKLELYYSINGHDVGSVHPVLRKNKSKSWYLLNLDITPDGANDIFIGVRNNTTRGVYFDDFRIHPLNGSLTSYVYDQHTGEVNYILDANNFYTHFTYDDMGRLIRTTKELLYFDYGNGKESLRGDKIVSDIKYNYKKGN